MCDICEKRKTLALKGLEAKKLASQIEATQMNYLVACANKNRAAMDSSRAEYHRLLDGLLDLHAITAELSEEVTLGMINMLFGDDDEAADHIQRGGHTIN
jgi:hypothetical protein